MLSKAEFLEESVNILLDMVKTVQQRMKKTAKGGVVKEYAHVIVFDGEEIDVNISILEKKKYRVVLRHSVSNKEMSFYTKLDVSFKDEVLDAINQLLNTQSVKMNAYKVFLMTVIGFLGVFYIFLGVAYSFATVLQNSLAQGVILMISVIVTMFLVLVLTFFHFLKKRMAPMPLLKNQKPL